MTDVKPPKPLTCHIYEGVAVATFDNEEATRYVENTSDTAFLVEDSEGRKAPILVSSLREFLSAASGKRN